MSPFLAWGDFYARSRFAHSTIPEEKWGTTGSLRTSESNQTNYPDLVSDLSSLRNSATVVSQTSVAEKPVGASLFLPSFCKELTKSIV